MIHYQTRRSTKKPPPELVFAYMEFDTACNVYAPFGVHYLLRLYRLKWYPLFWLLKHNWILVKEGDYIYNFKFNWSKFK